MNLFKKLEEIDKEKYFIATYFIRSNTNLRDAAWDIAIGQSVGNPSIRNQWEDDELYLNHSCLILNNEDILLNLKEGYIDIAFPLANIDWYGDGINHLICQLMGGHTDINIILRCRLVGLQLPNHIRAKFLGPKFGITGMRAQVNSYNKPLLGGILKPKVITRYDILADMTRALIDGGVDFIKEDEIMSNVHHFPLEQRVSIISNLQAKMNSNVVFCHTINADPHAVLDRARLVHKLGGNGVHVNVFGSLGVYNSIRKLDLPIYLHLQSSGQKVFTDLSNRYSISWPIVCQLATMIGVDTIQTGMIGGYSNDDPNEILACLKILREGNTIPALSCGFHPGLVDWVTNEVGKDYLANSGGAIHGHPGGTLAGTRAMRQAIDKVYGEEYEQAIAKWSKV